MPDRSRPGRPGADCRTTAPGTRCCPGQSYREVPAAGRCRAAPPERRSPARCPGRRRAAARTTAADSRSPRDQAPGRRTPDGTARDRGSQVPGIRAGCRTSPTAGSRSRRSPAAYRRGRPRGRPRDRQGKPGCRTGSSGPRKTGRSTPGRRSRSRPWPAAGTQGGCRRPTRAPHATPGLAAGSRRARRLRVRTAPRAVPTPGLPAVRFSPPIRSGPGYLGPHRNGDAAPMAIHCHRESANRSSYTGSLPVVLSYSRSMISSIIATNETLCYLLG